jgi:hypothetical protein
LKETGGVLAPSKILLRQKFQNKRKYKKGPKDLGQIKKQKMLEEKKKQGEAVCQWKNCTHS